MSHRSEVGTKTCSSLFLQEPLKWMGSMVDYEGTLLCPNSKCKAKLGSWNWGGSQCSCGTWVTPSISLVESKLDKHVVIESKPTPSSNIVNNAEEISEVVKIIDRSAIFKSEDTSQENPSQLSETHSNYLSEHPEVDSNSFRCSCSIHWFATMPPSSVVIWLHGKDQTSISAKEWVDMQWGGRLVQESHAAFIFPECGVSPSSGENVWFDEERSEEASNEQDINRLYLEILTMVDQIVQKGTLSNQIFLGGVGHGGVAALHVGLRMNHNNGHKLAGIFSLGGSLKDNSNLFSFLQNKYSSKTVGDEGEPFESQQTQPPVLCCHAKDDPDYACCEGERMVKTLGLILNQSGDLRAIEWFPYNGSRHDGGVRTLSNFIKSISMQNAPR